MVADRTAMSRHLRPAANGLAARMSLAAWLAFACCGAALAADAVIGSVLAVRGAVFVEDAQKSRQPLEANARVRTGQTIVSQAGKAKIALNDGSVLSIGENSRLRLADYRDAGQGVNARVTLIAGALRAVARTTPAGRFEVETETAIAAVRGTDWVMEATSDQTAVAVVSGAVSVSGRVAAEQGTVVLQGQGQGTDVRRGRPPTAPRQWPERRFSETLARATFD